MPRKTRHLPQQLMGPPPAEPAAQARRLKVGLGPEALAGPAQKQEPQGDTRAPWQ